MDKSRKSLHDYVEAINSQLNNIALRIVEHDGYSRLLWRTWWTDPDNNQQITITRSVYKFGYEGAFNEVIRLRSEKYADDLDEMCKSPPPLPKQLENLVENAKYIQLSPSKIKQIVDEYENSDQSVEELSKELKVAPSTIYRHAADNSLSGRIHSQREISEDKLLNVLWLYVLGVFTYSEIATYSGASRSFVRRIGEGLGWTEDIYQRKQKVPLYELLIFLYRTHSKTLKSISAYFNLSYRAVKYHSQKYGKQKSKKTQPLPDNMLFVKLKKLSEDHGCTIREYVITNGLEINQLYGKEGKLTSIDVQHIREFFDMPTYINNTKSISYNASNKDQLDIWILLAKEYYAEHGNLIVSRSECGKYKGLSKWISKVRGSKSKSLRNYIKMELPQLDLTITNSLKKQYVEKAYSSKYENDWREYFKRLKAFKNENGHCNVSQHDQDSEVAKLGRWVVRQRGRKKSNKLLPWQEVLLNEIELI